MVDYFCSSWGGSLITRLHLVTTLSRLWLQTNLYCTDSGSKWCNLLKMAAAILRCIRFTFLQWKKAETSIFFYSLWERQAEHRAFSLGGRNRRAAFEPRERVLDLMDRETTGARLSSFSPPDPFANPTNAAVAPPRQQQDQPHGEFWPKALGKKALHKRSAHRRRRSQCRQPALSRTDSACFAPKQTTHRLCVSPAEMQRL